MIFSHLRKLEAESIHILREVAATFSNPVMLYSIGKDSSVLMHLAMKAFCPGKPPFPFLHVDTTWKFKEMLTFRDQMAAKQGIELLVHINRDGIDQNVSPFTNSSNSYTQIMKTEALRQALDKYRFDAAFGGARRDEEKSRAKERIFSFRTAKHSWDPKNQRPEMWKTYNTRVNKGESIRVFPLSNWTELDIWQYIMQEKIPIVPLYFAAKRPVVDRDGMLILVDDERMPLAATDVVEERMVRFRTLGCYPLTGAIESTATTLEDIVGEVLAARTSERQGRFIDKDEAGSMEKKKREGYF
ncbi:sulfate adenylyltransferase subunit CysD [Rhizobium lusitanum]|uniref:sulfate adenylyltransferase subunit CysD n=1 Tax=Rhizobium lusitanum TaxID=293958 RepID=UPI001571D86B|nr:sulfate adenylyltransferase subunit CysD [Rhizobium lusitanum]NTJ11461.1 sulfate adenylyltransferase subunit CysD [Rhizobium lusitanum]